VSNNIHKSQGLTQSDTDEMFDRFSFQFVESCNTPEGKKHALSLSKLLWLRLVTGNDTETAIDDDLKKIFQNDDDSKNALVLLYFSHMKTALTKSEIKRLNEHFNGEDAISLILGLI
jgi:hypothetical protein